MTQARDAAASRDAELNWEWSVIATAIVDPSSLEAAEELLPSDFTGVNQIVWAELLNLRARNAVDLRSLGNALENCPDWERVSPEERPADYLAQAMVFRGSNMEAYVNAVLDRSTRRTLRRYAALIAQEAEDTGRPIEQVLDHAENKILSLRRNHKANDLSMADIMAIFSPRFEGMVEGTVRPCWEPEVQAIRDIVDYLEETDFMVCAARPGEGKCLARGTKVVMYGGYLLPVEEVRVGDYLMGPNSEPKRVLGINQGRGMLYWVRQNRGIDYRVNEHHILSLKRSKNEGVHRHGEIKNISVRELLDGPKSSSNRWKGYKVAVDFPERAVTIEPYFLGLWLGDGNSNCSTITNTDAEVIRYIYEYAQRRREVVCRHKLSYRIVPAVRRHDPKNVITLTGDLARANVLHQKHIPRAYLINSRKVRLELLAGLIDSDGSLAHNGVEITMQNKKLMEEIKYLADTLGFRTSPVYTRTAKCQTGAERTAYRITIHGDFTDCPIRIPRKKPDIRRKRVDWTMTGIRIEEDKVDDYYGFQLEGDGLFLLEDMTVTHNSSWMRYEFFQAARKYGRSVGILNYENDPLEYARYFLAIETGIDSLKIRKPSRLSAEEKTRIRAAVQLLARLPIRVVTTDRNVNAAIAKARKMVAQDKITLLGVDYIQLLNNGIENRVNDLTLTTGRLRQFALDFHVPVIANAQLSRDIERRGQDSEPRLDDLRESGSIEQDATIVMFPRPVRSPSVAVMEQFPENFDEHGRLMNSRPRAIPVHFHILKNRNGTIGVTDPVKWCKHLDTYHTLMRGSLGAR